MLLRENVLKATQREWKIDCTYSTLHYAVVMKYAKIEIKYNKTLFVQTEAEKMERKDEKQKLVRPKLLFSVEVFRHLGKESLYNSLS